MLTINIGSAASGEVTFPPALLRQTGPWMQSLTDVSYLQVAQTHHTTSFYMPRRDDYPDGAGSVGRPCGGGGAAAAVGRCPWGRSGVWSAMTLEGPQTTTTITTAIICQML